MKRVGWPGKSLANDEHSEVNFVFRMARGEAKAFTLFFDQYHRLVFAIAVRILRDMMDAEDLMQEVFLELWRVSKSYDPSRGTVRGWVARCAYHRALNRKQYLRRRLIGVPQPVVNTEDYSKPERNWNGLPLADWKRTFDAIIPLLTPAQRDSLRAVYFEGKQLSEVAQDTGQSLSNVKNHVYRGIRKLRVLLGVNGSKGLLRGAARKVG